MTPVIEAWQSALGAEHAAVYGYGLLGPVLDTPDAQALARADEDAHRGLRDAAVQTLAGFGVTPAAARASYLPPFPVRDATAAARFALVLEQDCSAAWRYLVAAAAADRTAPWSAPAQSAGQAGLTGSAVRALQWRMRLTPGDPTVAFPGI